MKILYFDTETTGINPEKNAIIQMSGIIEIDGVVRETFNFRMAPPADAIIEQGALDVTGLTKEVIMAYPDQRVVYGQIVKLFDKYVNKFKRSDKFFPAGYNIRFDIDFLNKFFKRNNNDYFGAYCAWQGMDALALVHYMRFIGELELPNYKLSTLCAHFGIEIKAHDAMSDITATRDLALKLKSMLQVVEPQK